MSGPKRLLALVLITVVFGTAGLLMYQRASAETGYAVAARDLEAGRTITVEDVARVSGRWGGPGLVSYQSLSALVGRRISHSMKQAEPFVVANLVEVAEAHLPELTARWSPPPGSPPPVVSDRFYVRHCAAADVPYELANEGTVSYDLTLCFNVSSRIDAPWPPPLFLSGSSPDDLIVEARQVSPPDENGVYRLVFYAELPLHERISRATLVRVVS